MLCKSNVIIYYFYIFLAQISQYSGHKSRTAFPKISINHDGRYLFAGCMRNGGLLWCTDYPFNDKPILKMGFTKARYIQEQGISDWCADPSNIKVGHLYNILYIICSVII